MLVTATASPALRAASIGDPVVGGGVEGGGGGFAARLPVRGFAAAFVRGLLPVVAFGAGGDPAAAPAPPARFELARLSLRTPGRERGRFPRTLSLSSLIAISSGGVTSDDSRTILLLAAVTELAGSDRTPVGGDNRAPDGLSA